MFIGLIEKCRTRVEADCASKQSEHVCPRCLSGVILAQGKVRSAYFRHHSNSDCPYGRAETKQHEQAKLAILHGARRRGLNADAELEVLSIDGDRRADVLVYAPSTANEKVPPLRRYAFEVQYSALATEQLMSRTLAYMSAAVPVIWIAVIDQTKLKSIFKVDENGMFVVSEFSVPSWVEDIGMLHQRLWLYIPETKGFWRGWLLPNWQFRNPTDSYYDSSRAYHSGRIGFWRQAAKCRDLYLMGPYSFDALKIARRDHSMNKVIAPNGEKRSLVELLPDGVETPLECQIEQRRIWHMRNGEETDDYYYAEWLSVDGKDVKATFSKVNSLPALRHPN